MPDPLWSGWPGDISQDEEFGLDETTAWDADESAALFVQVLFGMPPRPAFILLPDPARIEESVAFRTVVTRFESGKEQRRAKGLPRRRWRLQFRKGQVDIDELWSFYLARQGPVEPFWWANPVDNKAYLVRFSQMISRRALWRVAFETGLEFVEVK